MLLQSINKNLHGLTVFESTRASFRQIENFRNIDFEDLSRRWAALVIPITHESTNDAIDRSTIHYAKSASRPSLPKIMRLL
jgi:hypothetical protein